MIAIIVEEILALVGLALLAALLKRLSRLDMSLACILVGFIAGQIIAFIGFDTGVEAKDLQDIVFYIILPVLVFEAAWHLDAKLLRRWLWPVMLLATLGIVITSVIAAGLSYLGLQDPVGFPWVAALLTGAILSATDPVSVIDQLKAARAPADLGTLFEGESLFNDATAVVLFSLVLTMALTPEVIHANGVSLFTAVFLGGACLGLVTGLLASILLLVLGRPASTTIVLLFTAFGSFFLAEHLFHVSGIMAVMVAALIARSFLKEVEDTVASGLAHTWEWSSELLNSILFVIMGLVTTLEMFQAHWLAMLVAIGAAVIARVCAVAACGAVTGLTGRRIPRPWQFIMVWGGQRGVIALALALSLPSELDYGSTIQSMVFGVILFSLLVQGTTTAALIKRWAPERRLRVRH